MSGSDYLALGWLHHVNEVYAGTQTLRGKLLSQSGEFYHVLLPFNLPAELILS